jgi:hypothetical protein
LSCIAGFFSSEATRFIFLGMVFFLSPSFANLFFGLGLLQKS